jgi:hypothetical protein
MIRRGLPALGDEDRRVDSRLAKRAGPETIQVFDYQIAQQERAIARTSSG